MAFRVALLALASLLVVDAESLVHLPKNISDSLEFYRPQLPTLWANFVPASAGNCKEGSPPAKCYDMGKDLYRVDEKLYKARLRWISVLNKVKFDKVVMSYESDGTMNFDTKITFDNLPASLRVEVCVFGICSVASDGTSACCGPNKSITLVLSASCSETPPFVRNVVIKEAKVSPIVIEVAGIKKDFTEQVQTQLRAIVLGQGLDLANAQLQKLFGNSVVCKAPTDAPTDAPSDDTPLDV
ncbi:Aste57867_14562 [Aphanomyces stellatus]|uniref:Aste57867_14562 protein n=1 Tax=Aphanomyces stellatus TaxID=120398 RepID=A0A485L1S6_9STRA|nr:hypothetical protein As57867_014508 [Aphanomyces stellatus]VFT91382.1 Aste57867_14562 [Aphanomyces stellatus]